VTNVINSAVLLFLVPQTGKSIFTHAFFDSQFKKKYSEGKFYKFNNILVLLRNIQK
jgi:hypothetical protein